MQKQTKKFGPEPKPIALFPFAPRWSNASNARLVPFPRTWAHIRTPFWRARVTSQSARRRGLSGSGGTEPNGYTRVRVFGIPLLARSVCRAPNSCLLSLPLLLYRVGCYKRLKTRSGQRNEPGRRWIDRRVTCVANLRRKQKRNLRVKGLSRIIKKRDEAGRLSQSRFCILVVQLTRTTNTYAAENCRQYTASRMSVDAAFLWRRI